MTIFLDSPMTWVLKNLYLPFQLCCVCMRGVHKVMRLLNWVLPHELQKIYKKYHSNPLLWHLKWKFLASVLMSVNLKCNQIINVLVIKLIWRYILAEENDTAAYNVLQDVLGTYHRHLFWWRQILWFREFYTFGMQKNWLPYVQCWSIYLMPSKSYRNAPS